jgi:uncharacterized protein YciI
MTETRQYLYTIKPTRLQMLTDGRTAEEAKTLSNHFGYLEELAVDGVVLLAGRTQQDDESTFGNVLLQAGTQDAARAIMDNDPAVAGGVMHARLHAFAISIRAEAST